MIALASFFIIILITLIVARIGILALVATGLPIEIARFQARSALSGVGFTTTESETVVGHPIRRRIVLGLMLMGQAGLVSIAASLILTFAGGATPSQVVFRLAVIGAVITSILLVARNRHVETWLTRQIVRGLGQWTDLDVRDMVHLMQLTDDYAVTELFIEPGDWLADKRLADLELPDEGVLVLGVQRGSGDYIGAPRGETQVHPYDNLILYGHSAVLKELDERRDDITGDWQHEAAVATHRQSLAHADA